MQRGVHPAPRIVAADGLQRQATCRLQQPRPGGPEAPDDRPARHRRPRGAPTLVIAIEVAAVVVVIGRPGPGLDRGADVVDRQLLPIGDVADVLGERPVRAACVGWRGTGEVPRCLVEAGPGRDEPIPDRGLIAPQVARLRAHVESSHVGQRSAPKVDDGYRRARGWRGRHQALGRGRSPVAPPTSSLRLELVAQLDRPSVGGPHRLRQHRPQPSALQLVERRRRGAAG